MGDEGRIFIGASRNPDDSVKQPEHMLLRFGNRHGLVTGATGTGKTVTLQVIAESLSEAGVPVFAADVKGDLAGIGMAGAPKDSLVRRAAEIGMGDSYRHAAAPAVFYDLFGEQGHPIRTTITEMGPLLLSRLMDLNPTQEGVLNIAFKLADEEGLLLLDLKDLQALLADISERSREISGIYGNVSKPSVGAIQRALLVLEQQGADRFFGEPAFDVEDLLRTTRDGRGLVSVLAADRLMRSPRLYATFLLWLLSELFEELPEVGDVEKPRLVFFFDEAHLLFDEAPKALLEKVEQVVKLIRSKGVGVFFVTQNPLDVPDSVLSQLGNRVQHALRAYTPRDQKAVRVAADTFRPNPEIDTARAITALGVGEALVSMLDEKGIPATVQRTLIRPPSSRLGPITSEERQHLVTTSPLAGLYDRVVDRESAFEILRGRTEALQRREAEAAAEREQREEEKRRDAERREMERVERQEEREELRLRRERERQQREEEQAAERRDRSGRRARAEGSGGILADLGFGGGAPRRVSNRQTVAEAAVKSVVRSVGSSLGRALVRGVLGSIVRR